ncbi:MAG: sugar phosphate isomerase/epimerase [Deltaproteobacteria bacterium]|nr:sugar phosphate isomerase/epimerase [Deltaproteobacteria bacterium]
MDMSRVSTCSIALIDYPPEKAFEIIAAAGFKKVDVLERLPHLSLFPDDCNPESIKNAAEVHGLRIANLGTYVGGGLDGRRIAFSFHGWEVTNPERFTSYGFSSDDLDEQKTEFEQLKRAVDLAFFFGARSIRVVPGNDRASTVERIVPWFKLAVEYAAEKNIYMGIENHSCGIAGTPELLMELVEKVGSPFLGVLYEPGNLMHDTGTDYRAALEVMKDKIVHCHFKDCKPVRGGDYEMQHFGEGEIDFPWIMEQLDAVEYASDVALEYELHVPSPEEGLKKFYRDFAALFTPDF